MDCGYFNFNQSAILWGTTPSVMHKRLNKHGALVFPNMKMLNLSGMTSLKELKTPVQWLARKFPNLITLSCVNTFPGKLLSEWKNLHLLKSLQSIQIEHEMITDRNSWVNQTIEIASSSQLRNVVIVPRNSNEMRLGFGRNELQELEIPIKSFFPLQESSSILSLFQFPVFDIIFRGKKLSEHVLKEMKPYISDVDRRIQGFSFLHRVLADIPVNIDCLKYLVEEMGADVNLPIDNSTSKQNYSRNSGPKFISFERFKHIKNVYGIQLPYVPPHLISNGDPFNNAFDRLRIQTLGFSPLHQAIFADQEEIVAYLISKGAKVNSRIM